MIGIPTRKTLRKLPTQAAVHVIEATPEQSLVPYDENLLERARTQWQFGDWKSLAQINRDSLQHHPDRATLALLAAAGRLQTCETESARPYIQLARDWGVDKKLLSRILIAGVLNNLGRATAIVGNEASALEHFKNSIVVVTPESDVKLLAQARMGEQLQQLGLPMSSGIVGVVEIRPEQDSNNKASSAHKSRYQVHDYWRSSQQDPLGYVNANERRSVRLVEIFRQHVGPGRILEIGTNAGRNLHHLYAAGYIDLVGIEISPAAVTTLRNVYSELSSAEIHVGAVEDLIGTFPDKSFECVFTMAVLEHIHFDSDWVLAHIARIARRVITVEDEHRAGERHFPRNYESVFSNLGMRQVHMEDRTKWGLPTGFVARVFV